MTHFFVYTFGASLAFFLIYLSRRRSEIIQFPFLATCVGLGFVFPQLIGLVNVQSVPEVALIKTSIYSTMCLTMAIIGYSWAKKPYEMTKWKLKPQYLDLSAFLLMTFGLYFYLKVSDMAAEATALHGGFWTGAITIYVFFASAFKYGFILSIVSNLKRPSKLNFLMMMVGLVMYLDRIIFLGRRQDTVELMVIVALFLWLKKRMLPTRLVMIGVVFIGIIFVNTIGVYRSAVGSNTDVGKSVSVLSEVRDIRFTEIFLANIFNPMANLELKNAAITIEATDRRMQFDGGLSIWNSLVFSFVPGQLIGYENKKALMIEMEDVAFKEFSHTPWPGSTSTGMADTFRSFGYAGSLVFFAIGLILKKWFVGIYEGSQISVIVVMFFTAQALMAFTHNSHVFFLNFVNFAIFVLPLLALSRSDKSS